MPNIDDDARAWELAMTQRIGEAVTARRKALGLTAQKLEELTRNLGYPITRVAVSKIENNTRSAKFDVAELLILAAALDIPPMLLLFPDFPDGTVEVVPGVQRTSQSAADWLSGRGPGPSAEAEANAGVLLTAAVRGLLDAKIRWLVGRAEAIKDKSPGLADAIARFKSEVEIAEQQVSLAKAQVWGSDA
ncbi:helix-turn-helix domain-containing protein [Mycolicibacterium fortuitum]|uniref:helix-turn-helix domain-containing protein n=1 Tax=Mycolicibacterium fortuitum TaxID=1766 RepID=UPI00096BF9DA|nr:helix-turn-helix transcriptional regulator [Mycolicibacterium fortuitum]OMC02101.1 hypothetical protein A5734_15075 [Mycolicibacterium fortuitum]